jgi:outer membrane protein assembly factor BamB
LARRHYDQKTDDSDPRSAPMQPSLSRRGLLGLTVTSLSAGCSATPLRGDDRSFPDTDWPMTGRDSRNSAFMPDATVPDEVEERWSVSLSSWPVTSPVVADGTVYIGSQDELHAYRASDGNRRWTAELSGETFGTPAVDVDARTAYATSRGDGDDRPAEVVAVDTERGERRWKTAVGEESVYAVRLHDGDLFVRTEDACVSLGVGGDVRWRRDGLGPVANEEYNVSGLRAGDVAPAVTADRVYVTADSALLALSRETGEQVWEVPVEHAYGGPAVGDDAVYVQGYRSAKAVSVDGEVLWTRDRGALWQPAVADDAVFLEADDVAEVDPETGEMRWTYDVRTDVVAATPAVLGEYVLCVGVRSGALARERPWFGLGERARWLLDERPSDILSPAVGAGRMFLVMPFSDRLVAFA